MSSITRTNIGRISFFPETMSNLDGFEFYLKFKQNAPPPPRLDKWSLFRSMMDDQAMQKIPLDTVVS